MNMRSAIGLALLGCLALACSGEQQSAGAQPADGNQQTAGSVSWLQPPSGCELQKTSIYVTGNILDLESGEASCSRQIIVCGDSIRTDKTYNHKQGGKCPWAEGTTITQREDGRAVCCDEWNKAKQSKTPCDPLTDADCDGIPNDEDVETLTVGGSGAR